jgi:hypothetical protein
MEDKTEVIEKRDFGNGDIHSTITTPGLLIEVKYTPGTIGEQFFKQLLYIARQYSSDAEKPVPELLPLNIRKPEDYHGKDIDTLDKDGKLITIRIENDNDTKGGATIL